MHKEKWVYQNRLLEEGEYPWALLIDVDYLTNKRADTIELAFTLYLENIDNNTHSVYFEAGHKRPTEYLGIVVGHLSEYSTVTQYDIDHILDAILNAMLY